MPDVLSFGTMNTSQNRFFWRGAYSAGTLYNPYDVVSYLGAAYIALTTQSGVLPTTTGSWDQMTNAGGVTSVAGRVGNVTLSSSDLSDKDTINGVAGLDANAFLKSAEFNLTINAQTGTTYTIVAADRAKLLTLNNAGAVAVGLPQATGSFASGWFCEVENIGAGLVTITPTTSTVDGATSVTLKQFESVTLVSNGTNYFCLRSKVRASFSDITGTIAATQLPTPTASTLGGVASQVVVAHNFMTGINTSGFPTVAQPAFSDISGTVAAAQLPTPTASTLGGVQSFAAQTSKWINAISTAGVPSATQPASTDLSDVATLATLTGTQTLTNKTLGGTTPFNRLRANGGTAVVTGDFSISAAVTGLGSWGSTASIASVTGNDTAGSISITSSGTGQGANAGVKLTFHDGAFPSAPIAIGLRGDGSGPAAAPIFLLGSTTTSMTLGFAGTPVAGTTYIIWWYTIGK